MIRNAFEQEFYAMHGDVAPWGEEGTRRYDDDGAPIIRIATCGACGRSWDDALGTSMTPAPAARCPFEDEHEDEDESADDTVTAYWTVIVPYVPREFATEWHPTEPDGPFGLLNRGAFPSEADAIRWARAHLGGAPYTLKRCDNGEEPIACWHDGCYLAVDPSTGECEVHGMPEGEES